MDLSPEAIRASYAVCRRLGRRAGSNFSAALVLLPRAKRRAMDALYAFMRHSDDLVDNAPPGRPPADALLGWRRALERALSGDFDPPPISPAVSPAANDDPVGRALLPAVARTVKDYHIPPEHLRAVLDGVEMDLTRRRYRTFRQLADYCEHVASAVGMACIHVWGFEGRQAMAPARSAGIALQLTNILRDLREDVGRDRVYLPLEDLEECGYGVEELRAGVINSAFGRLMELEIGRAEEYYREGVPLLRWLRSDGQRIFGAMIGTYHALLTKIRRRPGDVFSRRIRLSRPRRLWIAARWAFGRPALKWPESRAKR